MQNMVDITLLLKYYQNATNNNETEEVELWLEQSEANKTTYNQYIAIWEHAAKSAILENIDVETDWKKTLEKSKRKKNKISKGFKNVLKIAAIIILMAFVGGLTKYYLSNNKVEMIVVDNLIGLKKTFLLSDSSEITLNKDGVLRYPDKFKKSKREVTFSGTGFFEIKHHSEQPFIINTQNSIIQVVGTSFMVYAYKDSTVVNVNQGKVKLFSKDNSDGVILTAHEKGLNYKGTISKSENTDKNVLAWKTRKLIFSNTPLKQVLEDLKQFYNVEFEVIESEVLSATLTVEFENETIENVLNVIRYTCFVEIKKNAGKYSIKKSIHN